MTCSPGPDRNRRVPQGLAGLLLTSATALGEPAIVDAAPGPR